MQTPDECSLDKRWPPGRAQRAPIIEGLCAPLPHLYLWLSLIMPHAQFPAAQVSVALSPALSCSLNLRCASQGTLGKLRKALGRRAPATIGRGMQVTMHAGGYAESKPARVTMRFPGLCVIPAQRENWARQWGWRGLACIPNSPSTLLYLCRPKRVCTVNPLYRGPCFSAKGRLAPYPDSCTSVLIIRYAETFQKLQELQNGTCDQR